MALALRRQSRAAHVEFRAAASHISLPFMVMRTKQRLRLLFGW